MTINAFSITAVRGIREQLTVALDGRSLLVRGDNGSGKSSISQALRLALTGSIASRAAVQLPPEYVRHQLETDPQAVRVEIALDNGRIVLSGESITCEGRGDDVRRMCVRAKPFLQRDELLAVVRDQPGDRFRYFESFLDLEPVDGLCSSLTQTKKQLAVRVKELEARRETTIRQARKAAPTLPDTATSLGIRDHLVEAAAHLGLAVDVGANMAEVCGALRAATNDASSHATGEQRARLITAQANAERLVPPEHPNKLLVPLDAAEKEAREADLLPLLELALVAVRHRSSDAACPVCEQDVEGGALAARLQARAALLQGLKQLGSLADIGAERWRAFLDELAELEQLAFGETSDTAVRHLGRALLEGLAKDDQLSDTVRTRLGRVRQGLGQEVRKLPDDAAMSGRRTLADAAVVLASRCDELDAIDAELMGATAEHDVIKALEKTVTEARQTVAQAILSGIESLAASFYAAIHPPGGGDEPTGSPKIRVKRHGNGTAHLTGTFNGKPVDDPQHLYSDGHLDTLALCVFLALRRSRADRERKGDPKLMVLDDIVTSIDMGHARRIVELLRDEFADHQLIILSHNEAFVRMCQTMLRDVKRTNIQRWTLEEGPRLVAHVSHVDRLRRDLAENGCAETVANSMRVVLDGFLHAAAHALGVSLPVAGNGLTVADYWNPLKGKLPAHARQHGLTDLTPILRRFGEPTFLRNSLGAHFNEWALDVGLGHVRAVAEALLDLIEALQCSACAVVARPKLRNDPTAGLACECGKKIAPTLKKVSQNGAAAEVEGT